DSKAPPSEVAADEVPPLPMPVEPSRAPAQTLTNPSNFVPDETMPPLPEPPSEVDPLKAASEATSIPLPVPVAAEADPLKAASEATNIPLPVDPLKAASAATSIPMPVPVSTQA